MHGQADLAPASLGETLALTFKVYGGAPRRYLTLAAVLQGPAYLLLSVLTASTTDAMLSAIQAATPEAALCVVLGASAPLLTGSLLTGGLYLLLGATVAVAVRWQTEGQPRSLPEVWGTTARQLRPLLGGTLLALAIVGVLLSVPLAAMGYVEGCYGAMQTEGVLETVRQAASAISRTALGRSLIWLALVLALLYVSYAAVNWLVLPQVAVFEGGTPAALLWRSRALVRPRWWGVAGLLLVLLILQSVVAALVTLPFSIVGAFLPNSGPLNMLGTTAGQVVGSPIGAIGTTLVYFYLRQRAGGATSQASGSAA